MGLHQRFFTGHLIHCRLIHWGESNGNMIYSRKPKKGYWLVVWSMFYFSIQLGMECHHPNWRTPSFFRGVGQPPTRLKHVNISFLHLAVVQNVAVLCPSSDTEKTEIVSWKDVYIDVELALTATSLESCFLYIYISIHIYLYIGNHPHMAQHFRSVKHEYFLMYIYIQIMHTPYIHTHNYTYI